MIVWPAFILYNFFYSRCNGDKHNAVFQLVKDLDVLAKPATHKANVFSNGDLLGTEITDKYHSLLLTIIKDAKNIEGIKTEAIVDYVKAE